MDEEKLRKQLMDRLTENYSDYQAALLQKERQELVDDAAQIARTTAVYGTLDGVSFSETEMTYLLKFQNPLEVIVDHWPHDDLQIGALETMHMVMEDMVDNQKDLLLYPLIEDAPAKGPETLRKFLNVDLEKVLPQIMKEKTAFFQDDLAYTLKDLRRGAASNDPEKRNFLVVFRPSGVDCMEEREMFIRDTRGFNICMYNLMSTEEPVLAYSVEITGDGKNGLRGNMYQQDNSRLASLIARASSPLSAYAYTFADEAQVNIPAREFDGHAWDILRSQHGKVMVKRFEPEDESVVQGLIAREHSRREKLPRGQMASHLQKLAKLRVQIEAERLVSTLQKYQEHPLPYQDPNTVKISSFFLPLASDAEKKQLFDMVSGRLKKPIHIEKKDEDIYISTQKGERAQEQKPSIKTQLLEKLMSGEKPAAKARDRGER